MDPDSAVEGVALKLVIDAIRRAFPIIDGRWVHLMALLGAAGITIALHNGFIDKMFSHGIQVFLAAIGANEVASRVTNVEIANRKIDEAIVDGVKDTIVEEVKEKVIKEVKDAVDG